MCVRGRIVINKELWLNEDNNSFCDVSIMFLIADVSKLLKLSARDIVELL